MQQPVHIQCVYGSSHVRHIRNVLLPALARSTTFPVRFITMNYDGTSPVCLSNECIDNVEIFDVPNASGKILGFAESHNLLFKAYRPQDAFVIINPDCIPHLGAIETLFSRRNILLRKSVKVGIVEGRQWPFEHTKEYDPLSLETPWASGAFCLIDAAFYQEVNGMEEIYFLYLEDVDLSWQAWLHGYTVVYEPAAVVTHFTGGYFYRDDLISYESYYGLRNFLIISRKFFGKEGEKKALALISQIPDQELAQAAILDYSQNYHNKISDYNIKIKHPKVKILGINLFHEVQRT